MTGGRPAGWSTSALGFDLLWTRLGLGPFPVALQLASRGATFAERDQLLLRELPALERAGAMSRGEVHPVLRQALGVLAAPELELDLRGKAIGRTWRVLGAAQGARGVVVVKEGDRTTISPVDAHQVLPHLTATLAAVPPGAPAQLNADTERLDAALAQRRSGPLALAGPLQSVGVTAEDALVLAEALTTISGRAAIGCAQRLRGRRLRHPHAVVVLDTARGRYLSTRTAARDGRSFTTIRPATAVDVVRAARALVGVERPADGSVLRSV